MICEFTEEELLKLSVSIQRQIESFTRILDNTATKITRHTLELNITNLEELKIKLDTYLDEATK